MHNQSAAFLWVASYEGCTPEQHCFKPTPEGPTKNENLGHTCGVMIEKQANMEGESLCLGASLT
jgi:hypothetical protein